jgi:hypothetical protein
LTRYGLECEKNQPGKWKLLSTCSQHGSFLLSHHLNIIIAFIPISDPWLTCYRLGLLHVSDFSFLGMLKLLVAHPTNAEKHRETSAPCSDKSKCYDGEPCPIEHTSTAVYVAFLPIVSRFEALITMPSQLHKATPMWKRCPNSLSGMHGHDGHGHNQDALPTNAMMSRARLPTKQTSSPVGPKRRSSALKVFLQPANKLAS